MEENIIYNAIKTPDGTILHSKHVHDFVMYLDKNGKEYGVDGGNVYLRRIGEYADCENISKYDDGKHETRRECVCWDSNYDKDMNRLQQIEYVFIKDLTIDYIKAILEGKHIDKNKFFKELFIKELEYRKDNNLE